MDACLANTHQTPKGNGAKEQLKGANQKSSCSRWLVCGGSQQDGWLVPGLALLAGYIIKIHSASSACSTRALSPSGWHNIKSCVHFKFNLEI